MALSISYNYTVQEMAGFADLRTIKWDSIRSPVPIFGTLFVYIFAIYFAIPRFMKNREAYSLKGFIRCYNLFQVIGNFWFTYKIVQDGGSWSVVWRYCDNIDNNCGRNTERQFESIWWIMWLRMFDLIETVMFTLRKKDNQISFLHVYHHFSSPLYIWLTLRYFVHGFMLFVAVLNCATHTIMYLYYFLSTYGSSMQRRLYPFKKWITIIQMIQILSLTLPNFQGFIFNCDDRIKYFSAMGIFCGVTNFALFWKFYMSSYMKLKRT